MARTRSLKHDFFTDADLCSWSPLHRILFEGLWVLADREGRLEDKPRDIKVKVLPFDPCDINAMLDDLARPKPDGSPFIIRYQVDGRRLIQVVKFKAHQSIHKDEKQSFLPEPPKRLAIVPPPVSAAQCEESPRVAENLGEPRRIQKGSGAPAAQNPEPHLDSVSSIPESVVCSPSSVSPAPPGRGVEVGQQEPPLGQRWTDFVDAWNTVRVERELPVETNPPRELGDWVAERWKEGTRPEAIMRAVRRFHEDAAFAEAGWPLRVFLSPNVYRNRTAPPPQGPERPWR